MIQRIYSALHGHVYRLTGKRLLNTESLPRVVSFSFDDFPVSAITGAKALEDRGWRGTFYVSPGLYNQHGATGQNCSHEDVLALHAGGHEIGAHTYSHFRCSNYGMRRSALKEELKKSKELLSPFDVVSFAFPFGAYDTGALSYFGRHYSTLRTVEAGINRNPIDAHRLKAFAIYENRNVADLERAIDDTAANGGWLIFYTHDVRANPSLCGCRPQTFEKVLARVKFHGLPVLPISDVAKNLNTTGKASGLRYVVPQRRP